jgi:CubicO group peptidase (beta-lactamase class C family)
MTLCGCRHYSSVWESLEIFDDTKLLYEPGSGFLYSSFDVNLVGAVLSRVEGEPYLDLLERIVFEPLGLTSAGGDHDGRARPNLATFYEIDGRRAREWRPFDLSQRWPGGGLVATSEELARIGNAWMDPDFIRPETRKTMWTPQVLSNGEVNEQSYALGWRFYPDAVHPGDSTKVLPYAHHGGVSKGAMSWLVVYPDYHLSIAVNINTRARTFGEFAEVEDRIAVLFLDRIEQLKQPDHESVSEPGNQ